MKDKKQKKEEEKQNIWIKRKGDSYIICLPVKICDLEFEKIRQEIFYYEKRRFFQKTISSHLGEAGALVVQVFMAVISNVEYIRFDSPYSFRIKLSKMPESLSKKRQLEDELVERCKKIVADYIIKGIEVKWLA